MNRVSWYNTLISITVLLMAQVLVFKDLVLFDQAFCFAYILIFLLLPLETHSVVRLMFGFVVGLFVDMFYHTWGIHAAASVLLCYSQHYWSQVMTPSGGYDIGVKINIRTQGFTGFLTYAYPLLLVHSLLLFFVEAADFTTFWFTLSKAFYSSLFTLAIVLIVQYLFYKKMK